MVLWKTLYETDISLKLNQRYISFSGCWMEALTSFDNYLFYHLEILEQHIKINRIINLIFFEFMSYFPCVFKRVLFLLVIIYMSLSFQGPSMMGLLDLQKGYQKILSNGEFSDLWLQNSKNPITVPALDSIDTFLLTDINYDLEISNIYLNHDSTDDLRVRITLDKKSSGKFEIKIKSDAQDIGETLVHYELFIEIPTGQDISIEWKKSYKFLNNYHHQEPLEL